MSISKKVQLQLDMLSALNKPNADREHFVERCLLDICNNQYIQIQILISELPEEQKKYLSAKMAEMNLTLCHAVYYVGLDTSKYRHWPLKQYAKLAEIPDTLSYSDPYDLPMLQESLSNILARTTGLFLANKDIVAKEEPEFGRVIKLLHGIVDYIRD